MTGCLFLPVFVTAAGCAVPQPRGDGMYSRVVEPRTKAVYHLYLPVDYVKNNGRHPLYPRIQRWPLVMTFHGMKPYDNAIPQEREWEKQADVYGYIVCAPQLSTSDSFMEYPLTKEHSYVLKDRENVLAIMDHVFETTLADHGAVLSTSWSCGGYLAHYFANRFPERFSCIATRLSNFSAKLLVEDTVPRYRDKTPVAIFIGDGDLPKCKSESEEAVAWYMARNFRVVRGKMIDEMGHRRIPQTAAAFFAEQIGLTPLDPIEAAKTVAQVRMTEYYPPPELIARMSPPAVSTPVLSSAPRPVTPPAGNTTVSRAAPLSYANTTAGREYPFDRTSGTAPANSGHGGPRTDSSRGNWLDPVDSPNSDSGESGRRFTPQNAGAKSYDRPATARSTASNPPAQMPTASPVANGNRSATPARVPVRTPPRRTAIRIKGPAVGSAPYYLSYSVDMPPALAQGADFLWKDNDVWMGDEPSGVKILETPGVHRITVLLVTKDNVEYRGMTTVQVLDRNATAASAAQ